MELTTFARNEQKKSHARQVRREGNIPAVVYSASEPARSITVDGAQFAAHLRTMKKGHLPNSVFALKDSSGNSIRAIVKDIQYHKVTYNIVHLDFFALNDAQEVVLNVPVELTGQADCVGVKAGGAIRVIKRHVRVKCKPSHIPSEVNVDVADLQIKASKRVRDVKLPQGVEIQATPQEVLVVVGKR